MLDVLKYISCQDSHDEILLGFSQERVEWLNNFQTQNSFEVLGEI